MGGSKRGGKPAAGAKAFGRDYEKNKSRGKGQDRVVRYDNEDGEDIEKRESDSENSSEEEKPVRRSFLSKKKEVESSSEEESSEEESSEEEDVSNPNRMKAVTKKISEIDVNASATKGAQLSRREKEELAKQNYQASQAKQQQKADMERLQLIRKQREEAAKRREEEKKAAEEKAAEKRRLGL
ncbi:hypothetical protein CYY_004368 [Polysphondylium violaceum]|uniref:Casein kinase substrate phosphoprotein PP28 domain-containing protein n=1 Tax=Polysphondylium violaceum TaxID=133409 RepID=A0A8J4V0D7_9MYCE|nr:hypothetical protein CYY_004368 [Polysphondylium violaceum]